MKRTPSHNDIDPLKDTEAEERVKIAEMRNPAESSARVPPRTQPADQSSSYEDYLFGRNLNSGLSPTGKAAWSDSTQGRVTIRMISRGIVGAGFFALGNRYASKALRDYTPDQFNHAQPLHWIAKGFDVAFGQPIKAFAWFIAPEGKREQWAKESVRFRDKSYFHNIEGRPLGRSLGAEMVAVTFDFAMMSIGDAMTRNIVSAIDPNVPQRWILNDKGKPTSYGHGHFDLGKWAESLGRSTWRVLTKNQGEDWAVALPYVYQMKWQRQALSKIPRYDGFKLVSDNHVNGGSLKMKISPLEGQSHVKAEIVGDYNEPGAIDLHCRFVGYNVFTQMFREMYDSIGYNVKKWKDEGFQVNLQLPQDPLSAAVHTVGDSARYLVKSFIKANMYMQPAVVPFWLMRTPQSKWRSPYIMPDHMEVSRMHPEMHEPYGFATTQPIKGDEWKRFKMDSIYRTGKGEHLRDYLNPGSGNKEMWFGEYRVAPEYAERILALDPHSAEACKTTFSKIVNPFGKASYTAGSGLTKVMKSTVRDENGKFAQFLGKNWYDREHLARSFVDASFAYTPYFIAKQEFGLRVDDKPSDGHSLGKMDKAIYGLIDNVARLNIGGVGASFGEIGNLIAGKGDPLYREDPEQLARMKRPDTTVQAGSIGNGTAIGKTEKLWAENVLGRRLGAEFAGPQSTVH